MSLIRIGIVLLALGFTACAPLPAPSTALPTPTPTPYASPTPTIVWFPPTPTPTLYIPPQVVPTPDQRPGIGSVIFHDPFTDPQGWQTFRTAMGSAAYGKNELTLAVAKPRGFLASLRQQPELSDFYLEMTASPSLCRGADYYGLMFRASSTLDGYRFVIACNGMIRLERMRDGTVTLLQNWIPSGQVPPGSPLVLRLGVWVVGKEMRFFINDYFQFAASDQTLRSGKLGVFARSVGDSPLTVSFSELVIHAVEPSANSAAPTPTP